MRSNREGTWFIQAAVDTFRNRYQNEHLEEMLITVRELLAEGANQNKNQMPCVWTTLTHRLYFEAC